MTNSVQPTFKTAPRHSLELGDEVEFDFCDGVERAFVVGIGGEYPSDRVRLRWIDRERLDMREDEMPASMLRLVEKARHERSDSWRPREGERVAVVTLSRTVKQFATVFAPCRAAVSGNTESDEFAEAVKTAVEEVAPLWQSKEDSFGFICEYEIDKAEPAP